MPGEGFKALADPTRRRILELLREGNCTAGELAEHFDISKPSLSHHLATLKNRRVGDRRAPWPKHRIQLKHHRHAGFNWLVYGLYKHGR